MRSVRTLLLAAAALCGLAATSTASEQDFKTLERGRYLATVGDCEACHNDPLSGVAYGGGRAIETPFGTILAPNVTADRDTGIGAWSDDEFVDALRRGTGRHGQRIYPAMPFPSFTKMTRDDALAIRAYLGTLPAVHHAVKADQLPFPFSVRASMTVWDALFFKEGAFVPTPGKSAVWNRGAFLVEGPDHCGACHTPKNLLGADRKGHEDQGAPIQGWWAPDITPSTTGGIGSWSTDDIVAYLQTGHNRFAAASGPMAEEVFLSSSRMTQADLQAIAAYLKDPPGPVGEAPATQPVASSDPAMGAGAALYRDECSSCHTPDGRGVPGLFPDLRHAGSVESADPASLLRVVIRGAHSVATANAPTGPAMPSFGWQLSDAEIAALSTYLRNSFGNVAPAVDEAAVNKVRNALARRSD